MCSRAQNLNQATIHVDCHHSGSRRKILPEKKDRDAWWRFLAGYPESAWSPKDGLARKRPGVSRLMRASGHSTEAVIPGDATSLSDVQPGDESSSFLMPCSVDLPGNAPRQSNSHCLRLSAESANPAPFAADPSISSEKVPEDQIEHLSPPEVTPSHLQEIDHVCHLLLNSVLFANSPAQRMSIHLLMYFTHWINIHLQTLSNSLTTISVSHGQWIFALLTKIDDQLSADEMNLLRNLARACLGLIQMHRGEYAKRDAVSEGVSGPVGVGDTMLMSDASCWIVFAAIAGYWGQRDLWGDAEAVLAGA